MLKVLAADSKPELSSACQQADESFRVPLCTHPEYVATMIELCLKQKVALLVPTIDTELSVLSENCEQFDAIGTRVVISTPAVIGLARDKLKTARVLAAAGVNTPLTMTLDEFRKNSDQLRWPVIAKPAGGSSSVGIIKPSRMGDLSNVTDEGYIVQELWRGREYTVNMFIDATGQYQCAVPHERLEVRAGEVSKGRTERVPALAEAAMKIAAALPGASGPLCFQSIVRDDGSYAVFEINARFGGGYPLAHQAGARFSQWLLEESLGLPCMANDDWRSGVTMLRYDAAVFLNE